MDALRDWLTDTDKLMREFNPDPEQMQSLIRHCRFLEEQLGSGLDECYTALRKLASRLVLNTDKVILHLRVEEIVPESMRSDIGKDEIRITVPAQVTRCGHSMHLLIPGAKHPKKQKPDNILIRGIAQGHEWLELLTSGKAKGVSEIAEIEGVVSTHVTRTIYRGLMAPDIIRSILDGNQPAHLTLEFLKQHLPLPIDWNEQRRLLGFPVR